MTVLGKFPAQARPPVVAWQMMMVNVTRQRMMQHKENKEQGHKMEPDLRPVQKYPPQSRPGSLGSSIKRET